MFVSASQKNNLQRGSTACFLVALLINILAATEVDLFVPSFPELQKVFHLSAFMVELTLGLNLIAHCIMAPIVGSLGDRYGTKPIMLFGLSIFVVGSICCAFTSQFSYLLVGRFLQGIGIAGPAVLGFMVIADMYSTARQQELLGILNGATTFAMAFAPVVGSYIGLYFHWRGNFIVLLGFGLLVLLLCILYIPASIKKPKVSASLKSYSIVFRSKKTLYYIFTISFLFLPYWIFVGMSPILYMNDLGVSLNTFGLYQGAMALMFSVGCFTSGYFLRKFGQKPCFVNSMRILVIFIFITLGMIFLEIKNPLIITLGMLLLSVGAIAPVNILYPLSLVSVPDAKGKISAVIISFRLLLTAVSLQVVSYFYNHSFSSVGIMMCCTLLIMFWFCRKLFQEEKVFEEA